MSTGTLSSLSPQVANRLAIKTRLILSGHCPPDVNMACDQVLLQSAGPPTLRLYGWDRPTLSLGYFQKAEDFRADQRTRVRRMTGGGAIHHENEITYCLVGDRKDLFWSTIDLYKQCHHIIQRALEKLGIVCAMRGGDAPLSPQGQDLFCFQGSTQLDLIEQHSQKKILGSAQRRLKNRVMIHGSLLLKHHLDNGGTAVSTVLNRELSYETMEKLLQNSFAQDPHFKLVPGKLTLDEQQRIASQRESTLVP